MLTLLAAATFGSPMVQTETVLLDAVSGAWSVQVQQGVDLKSTEAEVAVVLANGTEIVNTRKRGLAIGVEDPSISWLARGLAAGERRVYWLPEGTQWRPGAPMWVLLEGE